MEVEGWGSQNHSQFLAWASGCSVWPFPEAGKAGGTGFLAQMIVWNMLHLRCLRGIQVMMSGRYWTHKPGLRREVEQDEVTQERCGERKVNIEGERWVGRMGSLEFA